MEYQAPRPMNSTWFKHIFISQCSDIWSHLTVESHQRHLRNRSQVHIPRVFSLRRRYLHYADVCSFHHYPAWYPTSSPGNMEEVKQIPLIWEAQTTGNGGDVMHRSQEIMCSIRKQSDAVLRPVWASFWSQCLDVVLRPVFCESLCEDLDPQYSEIAEMLFDQ